MHTVLGSKVLAAIKVKPVTVENLSLRFRVKKKEITDTIRDLRKSGVRVEKFGNAYGIALIRNEKPKILEYHSRPDGTYLFGACGDNHIGSKYSRHDVLDMLYDRYEEEGVDRVFNTGNWIDGEARFNMHDLVVHGMDNQLNELTRVYPQRKGIVTYAVSGDDHEGWYDQKFGVDIGRRAEQSMREIGREDWVHLGFMESFIKLVDSRTGKSSTLAVVHPGGGSAYALSYSIQKIVESYEGGEKPAVGLYGHYHKLWSGNIRNMWAVQTGTTEDQTPFMRKKRLEAHVGGTLVKLRQDPATGAIVEMGCTILRYFNKGYYNGRWSHANRVVHAKRAP